MGSRSFTGVRRLGRGADNPPLSSAEVKERAELYLYSPLWGYVAYSGVIFTFTLDSYRLCCKKGYVSHK